MSCSWEHPLETSLHLHDVDEDGAPASCAKGSHTRS